MPSLKPILIIGGGLAGLTLGIGLRQRGVPVTIWEAGHYPRHRVCGEFISGQGPAVLERLGLLARCLQAGAIYARTTMFVCGAHRSPIRPLASPALCLSRHKLDALLAETFQQAGGELRVDSRRTPTAEAEGLVHASGRRSQPVGAVSRWFGVKAHVPRQYAVPLEADLEIHIAQDGYIGINRVGDGEANVCGLFHVSETGRRPALRSDWLRGAPDSLLRERLRAAEFDPASFCSVAGLPLQPQRASARSECCVGDRLTMTPPVTGNGMSMAFESAALAVQPLAEYSRGGIEWPAARRRIARECDEAFSRRLAWARLLQWMVISPLFQGRLAPFWLRSGWLWRTMFARTR